MTSDGISHTEMTSYLDNRYRWYLNHLEDKGLGYECLFGFTMEVKRDIRVNDFFGICYRLMGNIAPGDIIKVAPAISQWSGLQWYVPKSSRNNPDAFAVKEMLFRDKHERNKKQDNAKYNKEGLRRLGRNAGEWLGKAVNAEQLSGSLHEEDVILEAGYKCDVYLRSCNCKARYGWKDTLVGDFNDAVYELTRSDINGFQGQPYTKITKINDFVR